MKKKKNFVALKLIDPQFRPRRAKTALERDQQRDQWDRAAKHKKKDLDESYEMTFENFQVGDKVKIVDGPLRKVLDRAEQLRKKKEGTEEETRDKKTPEEGIVRVPSGPANTIGITLDGEYHLVDEEDVELIYEAFDDFNDLLEYRFVETSSGVTIPISGEEQAVLDRCATKTYKSSLDERDQEIARKMVSRGILNRFKDENGRLYFLAKQKKISRF